MQAKTGVQKSGAGIGGGAAKAAANSQGARPLLLSHQVMQAQLQDFRAMLEFILDRIQLGNRLSRHAEFGIAAGRAKLSLEVHAIENKQPACQKIRNCCNRRPAPAKLWKKAGGRRGNSRSTYIVQCNRESAPQAGAPRQDVWRGAR